MAISKEIIKHFYDKAVEEKDAIKTIYNDVLELTDPFSKIDDSGKQTLGELRNIDSTVIDTIDAFRSFIMSSVLPRQGEWATIQIDEERILDELGEGAQKEIDEVKKVLNENSKKVFKYLQASNYYKEVSKAIESFIKVGTGAFSIRESGSTAKPFMFSYVGLDNLYFLEDALSRPNIIFKLHPEVNASYMKDYFGAQCKVPSDIAEDRPEQNIDVYEVVIPEYDEQTTLTKYHYMVMSADFTDMYLETELTYSPIIVVRYDVIEGNSWGKSTVLALKNLLLELNNYKDLYITQARRIANPAAGFAGNMELFDQLSLEEGTISFLGDPNREGIQGQLTQLGGNQQLMPLDKLITEHRQIFRQALMVDDIVGASMQDGKGTTAQNGRAV
ncbi:MAG: portal protein [Fusobacteriaceae bacterium]